MSNEYTAQDMRMMAEEFFPTDDDVYGELVVANVDYSVHVNNRGTATVREMLLRAAEMRERAEAVIEKAKKTNETQMSYGCHSCVENYIKDINYIIRGDTGKELTMDNTKNALAKLAELMNTKVELAPINADGIVVLNADQFEAYKTAMRIVAELAKIRFEDGRHENDFEVDEVVGKCLAIAEESEAKR